MKTHAQPHQIATLTLSDADLVYMAQSALIWNRALPPGAIRASVTAGWLTLSGQVMWHYQRQDAAECVRYLPGPRRLQQRHHTARQRHYRRALKAWNARMKASRM